MTSNTLLRWTPWILVAIQAVVIIIILQNNLFLQLMRGAVDPKMVSIQNQQKLLKTDMNHTPEALKTDMTRTGDKAEGVCHEAEGDRFRIFCPFFMTSLPHQLLASPEDWLDRLEARFSWLDTIVASNDERTLLARSKLRTMNSSRTMSLVCVLVGKNIVLWHVEQLKKSPLT
jgi:hypothetical protein